MSRALVIVDVQRDFLPGGALAVPGGDAVLQPIRTLARDGGFDLVLATRDWHPPDHASFDAQGGPWPEHCVAGTPGADLHAELPHDHIDVVVDKGESDEGMGYSGMEADALRRVVRERGITELTVVGLATDYCVRATVADALDEGLDVTVVRSAIRGIDDADSERALSELAAAGATIVD